MPVAVKKGVPGLLLEEPVMCASGVQTGESRNQTSNGSVDRRLSRRQRITDSRIFRETFRAGKRYAGRLLVMWLRHDEDACLRLAVIVSKRVFRRSVDRSRAKRLLRESFRLNRNRLQGKVDIILVARGYIAGVCRQDVDRDLLGVARDAGILKEEKNL